MKKLLLAGLFLIGSVFCGSPAKAGLTPDVMNMATIGMAVSGTSGTFIYGLSAATPTVATIVNLTTYQGMFIQVTATSGANGVNIYWGNSSSAAGPWAMSGKIPSGTSIPLKKLNNFVRIEAYGSIDPSLISGFSAVKPTVTAQYLLLSGETLSVSGTVGLNSGAAVQIGGGTSTTVADSSSNTAPVFAAAQEDLTSMTVNSLSSSSVTTITVGSTPCGLGSSVWIGSPSANIFVLYGDLTFTPSANQMIAGIADQMAANALPIVLPWPVKDGSKIYLMGNGASATVSTRQGCFKSK